MSWYPFFVTFLLFVNSVLADKASGPYQALFFWYAYRLDNLRPSGEREIALGCTKAHGRMCTFDELTKFLQRSTQPWNGFTAVGKALNPDVVTTVEYLNAMEYSHNVPADKLLPNDPRFRDPRNHKFTNVFEAVMDIVQKARVELLDVYNIELELSRMRQCWAVIHTFRAAIHYDKVIEEFKGKAQEELGIHPDQVPTTTKFTPSDPLIRYEMLDEDKLISNNPQLRPRQIAFVRNFVHEYNRTRKGAKAGHFEAVQFCQTLESRINGPPGC